MLPHCLTMQLVISVQFAEKAAISSGRMPPMATLDGRHIKRNGSLVFSGHAWFSG